MAYVDKINNNDTNYDIQDSKAARSVDGTTSSHVEEANQIYTETTQTQTSSFTFRTTAGDVSISTGNATLNYIEGNTVQVGHVDEVLTMSTSFASSQTSATLNEGTWRGYVSTDGVYIFIYNGSDWQLNGTNVTLTDYGIAVTGSPENSDTITINYVQLVVGTLATATPAAFVSTGFNQYDSVAGYAHVKGDNQYRVAGTYTSLGFSTTIGGSTTAVTVTDGRFTPSEDGYIYVNGGSGDILIALVWSGTMDNEPFTAYDADTINMPTTDANSNNLPYVSYGLPSVNGVADRISFVDKTYVQRVGHYPYNAENLATVQAMGVDYIYDNSDIFYVLSTPNTYSLEDTISGLYIANDYGTEEFTSTSVQVIANITYGNSLVDKLRNLLDIQSIGSGLTLTGTELSASGGSSVNVVQTTGTSQTDVMSQNAVTSMVFKDGATAKRIAIGLNATTNKDDTAAICSSASVTAAGSLAFGKNASASHQYSIAMGYQAKTTRKGEINVGAGSYSAYGYNGTSPNRVIGGVYDGQLANDAVTVSQVNSVIDSINSALNTNIPHIGS